TGTGFAASGLLRGFAPRNDGARSEHKAIEMICPEEDRPEGLYGCGFIRDAEGAPLRPGGLALTETLLDFAGFRPGDTVADIGCGLGASIRLMNRRGIEAIGV